MTKLLKALFVSLAVHAAVALALVAWFEYAPGPDVLATLDLSSVELSFSETPDDTAAAAPSLPAAEANPKPPRPKDLERPPSPEEPPKALPPDPAAMRFVEPKESPPDMQTPKAAKDPESEKPQAAAQPSPAVAPRQARVDAPPQPRRTIRPDYPKGARQRGEQGDVTLEIRVNAEGAVDAVTVVRSSGFAELDEAAQRAAKAARFRPARAADRPVASLARLTLTFRLR